MRALLTIVAPILLCVATGTAVARDSRHLYPIAEALGTPKAKETLGTAVAFYFGNQEHPPAARTLGEHTANRKTNAANKSDRGSARHGLAPGDLGLPRCGVAKNDADGAASTPALHQEAGP